MHTFDFLPVVYANIYVYRPHSPCLCYRACALTVMMIEHECARAAMACVLVVQSESILG